MVTVVLCTLKKNIKIKTKFPVIIVSPIRYEHPGYIQDEGKGLARARNLALSKINSEYTIYIGDDNEIKDSDILNAIKYMKKMSWVGCGFMTRLKNPVTYFEKCINYRFDKRFKCGESSVIGTPFIFETDLLKQYKFDENCKYADDTDFCERLKNDKYRFGFSNITCYEILQRSAVNEIKDRFLMYGKSDSDYYKKYSAKWSLLRKIKSILHPLQAEWLWGLYYIPFSLFIIYFRYKGWLKNK